MFFYFLEGSLVQEVKFFFILSDGQVKKIETLKAYVFNVNFFIGLRLSQDIYMYKPRRFTVRVFPNCVVRQNFI